MCADMCIDVCVDVHVHMCMGVNIDIVADTCTDMYTDMCRHVLRRVCRHVYGRSRCRHVYGHVHGRSSLIIDEWSESLSSQSRTHTDVCAHASRVHAGQHLQYLCARTRGVPCNDRRRHAMCTHPQAPQTPELCLLLRHVLQHAWRHVLHGRTADASEPESSAWSSANSFRLRLAAFPAAAAAIASAAACVSSACVSVCLDAGVAGMDVPPRLRVAPPHWQV